MKKLNVVSAHITATLSGVLSVVALLHPGFHLPSVTQTVVTCTGIVVAGIVEVYHLLTHRQIQQALVVAGATLQATQQAAADQLKK